MEQRDENAFQLGISLLWCFLYSRLWWWEFKPILHSPIRCPLLHILLNLDILTTGKQNKRETTVWQVTQENKLKSSNAVSNEVWDGAFILLARLIVSPNLKYVEVLWVKPRAPVVCFVTRLESCLDYERLQIRIFPKHYDFEKHIRLDNYSHMQLLC